MKSVSSLARQRALSSPLLTRKAVPIQQDNGQAKEVSNNAATQMLFAPRPFEEMPGPKGLPVIGTLIDYIKPQGFRFNKMFEVFQQRATDYGPVYREQIGDRLSVVVTDPIEYAKVVRIDGRTPVRFELEPMVHYRNKKGLCLGPVNSQGEEWYRHRHALSKKMLRPKEMLEYVEPMSEVVDDLIHSMTRNLDPRGHVSQLDSLFFKWSFESVCCFLFDERMGCFADPPSPKAEAFVDNLVNFFRTMQELMYDVPLYKVIPTPMWKQYERYSDNVHSLGRYFVNKKLQTMEKGGGESKDGRVPFLTCLLQQSSITPDEAVSHTVDLMMGGVETSSNAMLWTLYNLALHPQAQQLLYDEVSQALPDDGKITSEVLNKLYVTKACLKETFRLYPITFATSRIVNEEVEIGGYVVPAGTHVQANLYGMGHDPGLFPDPEVYRPERWMRGSLDSDSSIQAFTSLPWGHGPRMCLGRRLAEQEIYIALSKIIKLFEVDYQAEGVKPVLNTIMTPDRDVKLIFKLRPKSRTQSRVYENETTDMTLAAFPAVEENL